MIQAATANKLSIVAIDSTYWKKGVVVEYSPADDYERAQIYNIKNVHPQLKVIEDPSL